MQGLVASTSARFQNVSFSLVQNVYDMNPHTEEKSGGEAVFRM